MSEEKTEVIIVGAGPAGIACAWLLAREGKEVILIERGERPGHKNMTGGRLYTHALNLLSPGLEQEAALERKVVREQIMMMSANGAVTIDCHDEGMAEGDTQSYTVLHAPFCDWLATKAEEAGAILASGICVNDLIIEQGKVCGVVAGGEKMYADLVIAADGVNSLLARKAGLAPHVDSHTVGVGIKEVIALPPAEIEKRFGLAAGKGAARVILGCTGGIPGGGAIYTNKESISLCCVYNPAKAAESGQKIHALFQQYKTHAGLRPLIEDGKTIEYGAHLVMENGWRDAMKKPFCNGLLVIGEAAGYVINTGCIIRGIDLAIMSGVAATRAILDKGRTASLGDAYVAALESIELNPSMRALQRWPDFMASPRLFAAYPDMSVEMMRLLFRVDGKTPPRMLPGMKKILSKHATYGQLISDAWKGYRAL